MAGTMQSLHNNCRSRAISPLDRALQTPPSLRPYITFSAAKPCGYTHKALHAQPAHPAARRPTAAQAASVTTASSQEATQAFERLCSIPGVAGHVRIHHHAPMHTATSLVQVALQEGEYGRGMMLTQPVQSGTSAAPGVACSVPLHLSLVLVKEKEMFSRGPLEWHERYLQTWQAQLNATLPDRLLRVLRSEKENDLLRLTAWLVWAVKHTQFWADYAANLLPGRDAPQSMIWAPPDMYATTQDAGLVDHRSAHAVQGIRAKVLALLQDCGTADVTDADVAWAMDMVTSRSITIPMSSTYVCMAPLADMANHNRATQWHFHMDVNGGAFQIRHKGGVGTIPSGAEVFVSYSSTMSNAQLLYAFGFVIPGNPNDRLDIPRQLLQQGQARIAPEAVVAAKRRLQAALPSGDVVSSCRLDAATGSLLKVTTPGWCYFPEGAPPPGDPSAPGTALPRQGSGPKEHLEACAEVARVVQERLSAAPTTLAQDTAELAAMMAGPQAHTLARHCVQYRAEWKHVAGAVLDVLLEVQQQCAADLE